MISIKSPRAEELPRGHLIALMTNDSRRSVTRRRPKIGSGEAAAPHSTPEAARLRRLAIVRMSRLFMCLTHMFADLKAAGIVARHCIFEERGAL